MITIKKLLASILASSFMLSTYGFTTIMASAAGAGTTTTTTVINNDEELPQTGCSNIYKAIAGFATLMTIGGAALVVKTRKENE